MLKQGKQKQLIWLLADVEAEIKQIAQDLPGEWAVNSTCSALLTAAIQDPEIKRVLIGRVIELKVNKGCDFFTSEAEREDRIRAKFPNSTPGLLCEFCYAAFGSIDMRRRHEGVCHKRPLEMEVRIRN